MPERFLGIDTSNYRTSAAIYNARLVSGSTAADC
mgnify:CR=1 FL=1